MKALILISLAAFCWLLGGCASKPATKGPEEASVPMVGSRAPASEPTTTGPKDIPDTMDLPADGPEPTHPRLAARGYLYTSQPTPRGYGAYAYVIFNADPRRIERERCLALCQAFSGHLPSTSATASVAEKKSEMVTFWPLRGDVLGEEPECDALIANYDRAFAARVAASIGKQGVRGPLLVAWTQPYGETRSEALILDMSSFAPNDLGRAVGIWKTRIAMDPAVWQRGWKTVVIKEKLRNGIENIGPGVVTVVATFLPKK